MSHAICALAAGFAVSASAATHLVMPQRPEWSLTLPVNGVERQVRLPAERKLVDSLPEKERTAIQRRIRMVEANQAVTHRVGRAFFGAAPTTGARLTPDYERTLAEAALSISYSDREAANPLERHLPILAALPSYTRVHVVTPGLAEESAKRALAEAGYAKRSVLHSTLAWNRAKQRLNRYTRATRWIRDTFMVGRSTDGKAAIFVPLAYSNVDDLEDSDLNFLSYKWHDPKRVARVPGFVRGGNVLVADNREGKRIAFVGADEIEQNEMHFRHATGVTPPRDLVPEIVRRMAGTERAVILPNSTFLFHIDMAMSFLAPGVVALVAPIDEWRLKPEEAKVLANVRKALPQHGFRVVSVPTTAARVGAYRSAVNIVPFVDRDSGRRRALVPRFEDVTVEIDGRPQSLNEAVRRAYEAAGIEVTWVEDRFSDRAGNLHCAVLALN